MVGTGILPNNMRSPSPECYTSFWMMTTNSDTLHWSDITPIFDRYWCGPFSWLCKVFIEHMQRVRHANRGRLRLRTPGPVPLWDLQVLQCWDQSLLNLSCLLTFEFRTSLGTFLLLWVSSLEHVKPFCLAKDHWWGFITRNAHIVHIVKFKKSDWKCCIHLSRSLFSYLCQFFMRGINYIGNTVLCTLLTHALRLRWKIWIKKTYVFSIVFYSEVLYTNSHLK